MPIPRIKNARGIELRTDRRGRFSGHVRAVRETHAGHGRTVAFDANTRLSTRSATSRHLCASGRRRLHCRSSERNVLHCCRARLRRAPSVRRRKIGSCLASASAESGSDLFAIAFHATERCARMRPIDRRAAGFRGSGRLRRAWSDARAGRLTSASAGVDQTLATPASRRIVDVGVHH